MSESVGTCLPPSLRSRSRNRSTLYQDPLYLPLMMMTLMMMTRSPLVLPRIPLSTRDERKYLKWVRAIRAGWTSYDWLPYIGFWMREALLNFDCKWKACNGESMRMQFAIVRTHPGLYSVIPKWWNYSRFSLIRSPLELCSLAGIVRWLYFGK